MKKCPQSILIAVGLWLNLATSALAVEVPSSAVTDASNDPLWEMRLAGFGRYGPSYPASEESQVNIVPLPLPIYRGKFLRLGEDSESPVRGRIFRRGRVKLDFAFDLNFPVDSEDISARTDMPDLDLMLEVGPEIEFQFTKTPKLGGHWYLGLQLRPAFSFDSIKPEFRGVAFSPEFTYQINFDAGRDSIKFRVTPTWGSSKYTGFFYGVDSKYATASRSAYEARSGYIGTDLTFSWINTISERWQFVAGTRWSVYKGAANAASPLFTKDYGIGVYAAFTWKFWESQRRATLPN